MIALGFFINNYVLARSNVAGNLLRFVFIKSGPAFLLGLIFANSLGGINPNFLIYSNN
jgi:hypothetical protein